MVPRSILAAGPAVTVAGLVGLSATAVAYGAANPCPEQGLMFGAGAAVLGGVGCAAFRATPGRLAQMWLGFGERANPLLLRIYRPSAPYVWRWGLICALAALMALAVRGLGPSRYCS